MNKDSFKEKLHNIKNIVSNNLSSDEEEEINIFIDKITQDLQEKLNKINNKKLTYAVKKALKENKDV